VDVPSLPTAAQVANCLVEETIYDANPWNDGAGTDGFRNRLEGWTGLGSLHNRVHRWVGGSMSPASSPNDPVYFLHHCNVDRLWAQWQREHSNPPYAPTDADGPVVGTVDLTGHRPGDSMQPWGGTTTVGSTFNHHSVGYWYDDEPAEVTLITPSVSFADVPEGTGGVGVTTYRAIVFEVRSCSPVTLEIIAGPTAGFTVTSLGTSAIVPAAHGDQPAIGRLWIAYTSTTAGSSANGSVTVGEVGTTNQWVVTLAANTIARPRSAVALALDRSGSMADQAGDGLTKVQKLKEAVSVFVDVMREGDGVGIVSFDDVTDRLMEVVDVGPQPATPGSGRAQVEGILAGPDLDPRGATGIGAAVVESADALADAQAAASPPYDVQGLVVLTDGNENVAPFIADVASSINAHTFAVGFGTPANVSAAALSALANGTGGYLLVTGALDQDQTFRLSKYFLQILAGVTNAAVVVDPTNVLVPGPWHRIPFTLTEADYGADVILLTPAPKLVEFRLETPDGTVIDPSTVSAEPLVAFIEGRWVTYYRMALPALAARPFGSHAGEWRALVRLRGGHEDGRRVRFVATDQVGGWARRGALPYSLIVHAQSSLSFTAQLTQRTVEPGDPIIISARLSEYGVGVSGARRVWAEVTDPEGGEFPVEFDDQGDGRFQGSFRGAFNGVYVARVRAAGTTMSGTPFRRELTLTAMVNAGGLPAPETGGSYGERGHDRGDLGRLLECLLSKEVTGSLVDEILSRYGGSREALERCLAGLRERPRPALRERLRGPAPDVRPLADVAAELTFEPLVEAEPVQRPPQEHEHEGPMFGLSPEDLAELGRPPERHDPGAAGGSELAGGKHGPDEGDHDRTHEAPKPRRRRPGRKSGE
ncbi:MAG: tyrosinase family protein, partial [Actinomycetota bacterium]|nr:tyrosinase family protein [Actinomycetota bacterium]